MLSYLLISSVAVMLVSLIGVFSVWKRAGHLIEKNLSFLVSFSAGIFLFVSLSLSIEAIEHASSPRAGMYWILAGFFFVLLLFKFLPSFHHHHDELEEGEVHSSIDARRILLSDGIHNIGDGLLLTASFLSGTLVGVLASISILVHELVQETSEFFVLKQAGFSIKKALFLNFLVSATILIGSVGGYIFLQEFEHLEVPILGLAAGSFFVVVIFDLIPHSVRTSKTSTKYFIHLSWFLLGILLMFTISQIFGH